MTTRVLIMAGGTGGHVFPALAVAEKLKQQQAEVFWMGTAQGIEAKLVPASGYPLHCIRVQGLRGKGLTGWLLAPFKLARAVMAARAVIRQLQPDAVLGLGGFASGPGGLAAKMQGCPLIIHEQNAIPGLTNRLLSRFADKVLEGFPHSFAMTEKVEWVGNPVRDSIEDLPDPRQRMQARQGDRHILVIGGSLGAKTLNTLLPQVFAEIGAITITHQCGNRHIDDCRHHYQQAGVNAEVVPFIEDMAAAYAKADLVICRAGALTVAELAAAGVASILVPFPYAVDDHQTKNAAMLVQAGAAIIMQESELTPEALKKEIMALIADRSVLIAMAEKARGCAKEKVASHMASRCLEVAHG